jgi:DNA-binding transcriptional ArsR family regulator
MIRGERSNKVTDDRLDAILHALSDRTRRALLKRLSAGPAMVTQLAAPFAMSRIAVGKHLRVLEEAGLVSRNVEGRVHRCSLNGRPLHEVEKWLEDYRLFWTQKLDALATFAEKRSPVRSRKA